MKVYNFLQEARLNNVREWHADDTDQTGLTDLFSTTDLIRANTLDPCHPCAI